MKFSFFTLILSIAIGPLLFSQVQRAYYWPLQQGAALDFSGGQPQFVTDCALWSFEACGAICDEQGQLLMYTNGGGRDSPFQPKGTIWNKNHQVLYDMGNTEGGGYSAMQGATIIPAPGKPHHYYVLTMEEAEFDANGGGVPGQPVGRGFSAFLVNMEANGGTGEVVQYWPMIFTPAYEAMCAIRHPNCEDYWVIINRYESGDFLVFPITSNGIGTPKYFNFSRPFEPVYGGGEIKASPDARWVISAQHIFKFDAINGTLSYHHKLNGDTFFGSFSPNSRYYYAQVTSNIIRYDLSATNPDASMEVIASLGEFGLGERGSMQLGPDGSIWFRERPTNEPGKDYLNAIRQPDAVDAFVETKIFTLPVSSATPLLPDFPAQWFSSTPVPAAPLVALPDMALCGDSSLVLATGVTGFPVVWNTGDTTPTLTVSDPGVYVATALGCTSISDTIIVTESNCACPILIPNAFTPNGDFNNELFGPVNAPDGYSMRIWSRWGHSVFNYTGDAGAASWDGMYQGQPAPPDVYVYQIHWEVCNITKTGELTLIR